MNDKCTILLLSCDAYLDVVKTNLKFLETYWNNCPFEIYIGIENADYKYNGLLNVKVFHSKSKEWTRRVKEHIRNIPSDFIITILDDFFIEEIVEEKVIFNALDIMQANRKIANIAFVHFNGKKRREKNIDIYEYRVKDSQCLVNWQIGIWNKEALLSLLVDEENPWESELLGSLRAQYCSDYEFYCLENDEYRPIKYGMGWLIVRGKWNSREIKRIEDKCKIALNPKNRPVEDIIRIERSLKERIKTRARLIGYEISLKIATKSRDKKV